MATQQQVIKTFMASLDNTTRVNVSAVDEAVRACSSFASAQDVINNMISDLKSAGSGDSFLRNYCGIILGNDDTGAITGSDAGSGVTKTGTGVVPNGTFDTSFDGTSFTTRGVTFQLAYEDNEGYRYPLYNFDALTESEKHVWQGLKSFWAEESLKLIEESYGYSLTDSDSQYRNIRVYFIDNPNKSTAWTGTAIFGTDEKRIYMYINMHYFNSNYVNPNDLDGKCSYWGGTYYLDRLIAHEFTHAVMNAKVNNFSNLPKIIKEGLAELTSGMDDEQYNNIKTAVSSENMLKKLLVLQEDYNEVDGIGNEDYIAGYMFLRYLAKQASSADDTGQNVKNVTTNTVISGTGYADSIVNFASNVTIFGNTANDTILSYGGRSSKIYGGDGDDNILNGGNTGNSLWGNHATLVGGAGNDSFANWSDDVTIIGGTGDDTIYNGENRSRSVIQYTNGDGNDIIHNLGSSDTLSISGGSYTRSTVGNDVIVKVGSGSVKLIGAKGKTVNIKGTQASALTTSKTLNVTNSTKSPVTLAADYANADASKRTTAVKITGNDKANSIIGGTGGDTLWGGKGNDTLKGGAGNDIFVYSAGKDVIADFASSDKISLGAAVSKSTVSGSDVVFTIGTGSLTVKNAKGKSLSMIDKAGKAYTTVVGTAATATLTVSNSTKSPIKLEAKYKTADASSRTTAVKITGNAEANSIIGGKGNDTLDGGKGNDSLWGNAGKDVFIYSDDEGKDIMLRLKISLRQLST